MPILLVNQAQNFNKFKGDGILGIGRKSDSEFNITLLDALLDQNLITSRIFSLYLSNINCDNSSYITFGGY